MRRSSSIAVKRVKTAKIPCWERNARNNEMTLDDENCIVPDERWTKKATTWNPGLSTKYQTNRTVGRPNKRWEDEINDFFKSEETNETKSNEIKKILE